MGESMKTSMLSAQRPRPFRRCIMAVVCVFLVLIVVAVLLFARLRPMIRPIAVARAKSIATRSINAAVDQVLAMDSVSYESLISLETDEANRVTALKTNTAQINRLKAELTSVISDRVSRLDSASISIPIGSVIGGELLSGVGPRIYIDLLPVGYAETDIVNTFSSAGINQTIHQILLEVTVTIGIVMPAYTEYATVSTSIVLGESVLLGNVPDNYTNVATNEELWDKINNFLELG